MATCRTDIPLRLAEGPQNVDRGAAPQFRHAQVEEHRPFVVVATGTQGLAQPSVALAMALGAAHLDPVGTSPPSGMTPTVFSPPVYRPEARGRQGDQHGGVICHRFGDPFAATQTRCHELRRRRPGRPRNRAGTASLGAVPHAFRSTLSGSWRVSKVTVRVVPRTWVTRPSRRRGRRQQPARFTASTKPS